MSKMSLRAFFAPITLGALCFAALTTAAEAQVAQVTVTKAMVYSYATALQSITVKAPAAGNMIVTAAGQMNYWHVQGKPTTWCVALSNTSADTSSCAAKPGTSWAAHNYIPAQVLPSDSLYGSLESYSIVRVYPVTSGTVYTFYLNGLESGVPVAANLSQPTLTAQFVAGTLAPK